MAPPKLQAIKGGKPEAAPFDLNKLDLNEQAASIRRVLRSVNPGIRVTRERGTAAGWVDVQRPTYEKPPITDLQWKQLEKLEVADRWGNLKTISPEDRKYLLQKWLADPELATLVMGTKTPQAKPKTPTWEEVFRDHRHLLRQDIKHRFITAAREQIQKAPKFSYAAIPLTWFPADVGELHKSNGISHLIKIGILAEVNGNKLQFTDLGRKFLGQPISAATKPKNPNEAIQQAAIAAIPEYHAWINETTGIEWAGYNPDPKDPQYRIFGSAVETLFFTRVNGGSASIKIKWRYVAGKPGESWANTYEVSRNFGIPGFQANVQDTTDYVKTIQQAVSPEKLLPREEMERFGIQIQNIALTRKQIPTDLNERAAMIRRVASSVAPGISVTRGKGTASEYLRMSERKKGSITPSQWQQLENLGLALKAGTFATLSYENQGNRIANYLVDPQLAPIAMGEKPKTPPPKPAPPPPKPAPPPPKPAKPKRMYAAEVPKTTRVPPPPTPSVAKVYITDPDVLFHLGLIEGESWKAKQAKPNDSPFGVHMNRFAFEALQRTGEAQQGKTIAEVMPRGGVIKGTRGTWYAIASDGEVLMMRQFSTPEKRQLARGILRVG